MRGLCQCGSYLTVIDARPDLGIQSAVRTSGPHPPTLAISSCFTKFLYKRTGNIYMSAYLNTILMTAMTVANTTIYFQI